MATEIEYVKPNDDQCPPVWSDKKDDVDRREALKEWGISFEEMEDWYDRVHSTSPVFVTILTLETDVERFKRLHREWVIGTEKFSKLSDIILHSAYQEIIAIGPTVIPLIIESLAKKTDHWFWALKMLNQGEDVAEGTDTLDSAAAAWISWGKGKGYLASGE